MDHKKARKIMNTIAIGVVITVFITLLPIFIDSRREVIKILLIIMLLDIVFALIFLRCPYCHSLLNMRPLHQNYCENCGEKLD